MIQKKKKMSYTVSYTFKKIYRNHAIKFTCKKKKKLISNKKIACTFGITGVTSIPTADC